MALPSERMSIRSWISLVASAFFLVALHYAGPLQVIEKPLVKILRWSTAASSQLIAPEQTRLFTTDATVPEQQLHIDYLERENDQLRKELDFTRQQPNASTQAYILKQEQTDAGIFVTLDQGSAEGVRVGEPIVREGIFLGKIVRVEEHKSIAQWISDPSVSVSATIEGNDQAYGTVHGAQGAALIMDMVPQDVPLQPGQIVVTRGLEQETPARLYVGKIVQVEQKTGDLFQQAVVQPPRLGDLYFVTIVHAL